MDIKRINKPVVTMDSDITCKGSILFGSGCMKCVKCLDEWKMLMKKEKTPTTIKVFYKRNLKMTSGKLASQVAHAVKNLGSTPKDCDIHVLMASNKKFEEYKNFCCVNNIKHYIQKDKGLSEVKADTETVIAYIVNEDLKNE